MNPSTTVNIKGIKFQSFKVIRSLIQRCIENDEASIYYAIERFDDDSIIDLEEGTTSIGQAKYYNNDFSINSIEVVKSLKHFYNFYLKFIQDKAVFFEFYTCAKHKGENKSDYITAEESKELRDSKTNFLEVLSSGKLGKFEETIFSVLCRILEIPENTDNKVKILDFLDRIRWNFGMDSLEEIEQETLELMKKLPYYNHSFEGKEKFIYDHLVQKIEMSALNKDSLTNYMTYKDLEYAFRDLKDNDYKTHDNAHVEYESLEKINFLDFESKVKRVSPLNDKRYFNISKRKITRARSDHSRALPEKSSTYLYRVYEVCEEVIYSYSKNLESYTAEQIDELLENLFVETKAFLNDRKQDFSYAFDSDDVLRNSILMLLNDCYLDFK